MNSKFQLTVAALALAFIFPMLSEARMPEPPAVPLPLKGTEPHNPNVAGYYLQELVKRKLMTPEEADRTKTYLIFRHARRIQDLKEVSGMSREQRRAYMKHKRELRGNPLVEYANYCGFSYKRAEELMNLMHDSNKGTKYYNQMKEKNAH